MIITRFAPSPTGELHIGGARTALFEYLFAKNCGGKFLLRIEDTDRGRFVEGSTERIIESLKWLGISPDNTDNIMVQSERKEIYKKHALELVEKGAAYVCECSKERLEALRKEQEANKQAPGYDSHCRDMNLPYKEGCVIRLKMPKEGKIAVNDLIRGKVEFDFSLIDDPVILKSDGFPTYHLAVVVDDKEMGITHVLRAEEWLPSTPKHLVLYKAFGWDAPRFAHLPMILAPDRTKLSKRHGATSVVEFKNLGYLPEAIVNFVALMGWNPKDEREIFSLEELAKEFKVENVNKAPAIFNIEKLNSINEEYIRRKAKDERREFEQLVAEFGVTDLNDGERELLGRGGFKTLKEAAEYILNLRKEIDYPAEMLVFRKSDQEKTIKGMRDALSAMRETTDWNTEKIQEILSQIVQLNGLTNGDVFWPVRVALSGAEKSPSPVELMVALGKEESLKRIEKAISVLSSRT